MQLNPMQPSVCHHCCHDFDTEAVRIPARRTAQGFEFYGGVYCSLNCARSASHTLRPRPDIGLLRMLWREVDPERHHPTIPIEPAPPFQALTMFGGYLSIQEFRRGFIQFGHDRNGAVQRLRLLQAPECIQQREIVTDVGLFKRSNRMENYLT